ncbi:MAG: Fur family transcriptional regulator [Verrucomicrobiota bacterium]
MKSGQQFLRRLLDCIEDSPLRLTRKRRGLLEVMTSFDRPFLASELLEKARLPTGDLVTIYRTLEAFEGIGIVQRIPLENGGHLFELTEPHDHHHHFVCRQCYRTERLDLCLANDLEKRARRLGFSDITHTMEVYGLCADCR